MNGFRGVELIGPNVSSRLTVQAWHRTVHFWANSKVLVINTSSFNLIYPTISTMVWNMKILSWTIYFIWGFGRFAIRSLLGTLSRNAVWLLRLLISHIKCIMTNHHWLNWEKQYVTKVIPNHLERPLYVFQSSFLLHNVLRNWAPMKNILFEIPAEFRNGILGFFTFGWLFLVLVTIIHLPLRLVRISL